MDNSFLGAIDEVSVYNRPLAAGEVQAIYTAGSTGKCIPTSPPFSDGLVAYYPLNGNANDASGNGKHGTALNGVSYVTDVRGTVAHFNGSSQYISLPNSISNYMDLSVTFWLKTSDSNPNAFPSGLFLVSRDIAGYAADWNICLGQGRKIQFLTDANALVPVNDAESNQWVHVACVADAAGQLKTIFLNGQPAASASSAPSAFANNNVPIFLGAATVETASHAFFTGSMADVRIYNRALSVSEVQQVYAYESASSCVPPPSGLVGWWPGESNALDSAESSDDGTLQGGVGYAAGKVGEAFVFNGIDGAVKVPANPTLNVGTGNGFAIEGWINPVDVSVQCPIVEWNSVTGGNPLPHRAHLWISVPTPIGTGPGSLYANIIDTGGAWHIFASPPGILVDNVFQHLALTYDKTSGLAKLFLNGTVVAQQNLGIFTPDTRSDLYLGHRPSPALFHFAGIIDEMTIYSRALQDAEIQAIYAAGSAGKCSIPPVIVSQPTDQTVTAGADVSFNVIASGPTPLSYQWRLNGTNLDGATSATLSLTSVTTGQAGSYSCRVTNVAGSATSSSATLTIIADTEVVFATHSNATTYPLAVWAVSGP